MKRKVILYMAVSLDGYIADRAGNIGWLGGEIRLFGDRNKEIKLHLVKSSEKNGVIDCLYERI